MHKQQLIAIAMAIMAVGAMGGIASADYVAPPSVDSSGTDDTASTSEVQPGDTLGPNSTFEANSSKNKTIQWLSDSNETKANVYRNGSGHVTFSDGTPTTVVWNSTDADGHYNTTFTHAQLLDVEHAAGENVTMKMEFVDNASLDEANQSVGNETFYVEFDNSTSVKHINSADADGVTVKSDTFSVLNRNFTIGPLHEDSSTIETNSRTVNGSQTDVYVTFSNQSVIDDFDSVASDKSSGDKLSTFFSTSRNLVLVKDDGGNWDAVPVYNSEAADDVSEDDTYAVYGTYGGSDGVKINLGSDYDDSSSVTVKAVGSGGIATHLKEYAMDSVPTMG